jgi:hypothetical protein
MHGVRRRLVESQAVAAGLPLFSVMLPHPCTNEVYEERIRAALARARKAGVMHMAFGDLRDLADQEDDVFGAMGPVGVGYGVAAGAGN